MYGTEAAVSCLPQKEAVGDHLRESVIATLCGARHRARVRATRGLIRVSVVKIGLDAARRPHLNRRTSSTHLAPLAGRGRIAKQSG
jgi:hypothetical protein